MMTVVAIAAMIAIIITVVLLIRWEHLVASASRKRARMERAARDRRIAQNRRE